MKNLTINKIFYDVRVKSGERYNAEIPFNKGLNIIYGPNSVGKSSIIIGIIYGLCAEKSLGIFRNKQNPFKPEFYDQIESKKVEKSYLLLEISNESETVTIFRNIVGETSIVAVYNDPISEVKLNGPHKKYIATGEGVMSDNGFQKFLLDYLDIPIVEVAKYEGGNSLIYLENMFPLFFAEQQAGWSEIQARQITRYGIRDVKRVVFEYLFNLDRFHNHVKELQKKELQEILLQKKKELKMSQENILVLVNGSIGSDQELIVDRPGQLKLQMADLISTLKNELDEKQNKILNLSDEEESSKEFETNRKESIKRTGYQIRKKTERVNALVSEIGGYTNYLERIEINRVKNLQLKKINNIETNLNLSICPACQNPLEDSEEGHCLLCSNEIKRISTPDENLRFLEDEKRSFEKVMSLKKLELRKEREALNKLREKEKGLTEELDYRIDTYYGKVIDGVRQLTSEIDTLQKDIGFYERSWKKWTDLNDLKQEIDGLNIKIENLSNQIKAYNESEEDKAKLDFLIKTFRTNVKALNLLKGKENLINKILLDATENYTPYLDEYDLYNITSSSDNVRIVMSYYLSLLQVSTKFEDTHFPRLLILDEPRQQNLDEEDLKGFIETIVAGFEGDFQVILTTYSEGKDRSVFEEFIVKEMTSKTDFLLKRTPAS